MQLKLRSNLRIVTVLLLISYIQLPTAAANQPPSTVEATDEPSVTTTPKPSLEERVKALEHIIERQQQEIQTLQQLVGQRHTESPLPAQAEDSPTLVAVKNTTPAAVNNDAPQSTDVEKKVDELYKKFGPLRLTGDVRFRLETFHNQGFDSPTELPSRNRLRVRARLGVQGELSRQFDWGVRVVTGNFTDPISTNQTLTDFFEYKPFMVDRAFVRFDSNTKTMGVQLVGGKFEPTFRRTQIAWDEDVSIEGGSEALYFKFKPASSLQQIKLVAIQAPFSERSSDKDGMVYGGQLQTDWKFSPSVTANVNVAYFDWTRPDLVFRALGAPATQVNGGISLATTNRVLRDTSGRPLGFLANFNLFDVLGNLTWQATEHYPVTFTVDYIRNLSGRIHDEQNGYWASVQFGQPKRPGDWMFEYIYLRIEQDAVLVPFNFSDILGSNSRVHIPTVAYQLARGVKAQWRGLFSQRANKLDLTSPINRWLNRMQFDVVYSF